MPIDKLIEGVVSMKVRKGFGLLVVVSVLSFGVGSSVGAHSDTTTHKLPSVPGHSIQSNCWFSHVWNSYSAQEFKVSAKLLGAKAPQQIKTAWNFTATGLGVSVSGVGACLGGNTYGSYIVNTKKQKVASHSGSFKLSGVPLWGNLSNTASVIVGGASGSASASCSRVY